MPRKSSQSKAAEGIAFLSALVGVDLTSDVEEAQNKFIEPADAPMLQAEGVLLHLQNAATSLMHKKCQECGEFFASRYYSVAYCSNYCRSRRLQRDFGILWDPKNDQYQNMNAERPILVGPQAYKVLEEFAHRFLEQHSFVLSQDVADVPEESHSHDSHTTHEVSLPQLETPLVSDPPSFGSPIQSSPFG